LQEKLKQNINDRIKRNIKPLMTVDESPHKRHNTLDFQKNSDFEIDQPFELDKSLEDFFMLDRKKSGDKVEGQEAK
jgi:hypothetical protein